MRIEVNISIVLAHTILYETKLELVPAGITDDAICSIVSGTTNAILSADAQRHAANVNADNVRATNAANLDMFQQARGSNGSAVLPTYLKDANGQPFETQLGSNLMDIWNEGQQFGPKFSDYNAANQPYRAMQGQAADAAGRIFNGQTGQELLGNLAPVQAARTRGVAFRRQSAIDSLNKTLGDIEATQAAHGFSGDSLGKRMLQFQAVKQAGDQGAAAQSDAELQNAQDERAVRDQITNLPLQNINLPYTLAQQQASAIAQPENAYLDQVARRLQPFNFMRIGTQPFQYTPMPIVQSQAGVGQLLAQGASSTGSTLLNLYLKQQQAQQLRNAAGQAGQNNSLFRDPSVVSPYSTPDTYGGQTWNSLYGDVAGSAAASAAADEALANAVW